MSEGGPERAADSIGSEEWAKPPWWLITSWGRWAFWTLIYPALMCAGPVERWKEGRSNGIDIVLTIALVGLVAHGLVQLGLTLRAYRSDPSLRTREWPSPPPGPGVSRRVWVTIALIAVAAIGLVLLIYGGWQGALFVVAILLGLLVLFVRFDLFADDRPSGQPGDRPDPSEPRSPTPGR